MNVKFTNLHIMEIYMRGLFFGECNQKKLDHRQTEGNDNFMQDLILCLYMWAHMVCGILIMT